MTVPFTPEQISNICRDKPTPELRALDWRTFQRWPAQIIQKKDVILGIINNELGRRG